MEQFESWNSVTSDKRRLEELTNAAMPIEEGWCELQTRIGRIPFDNFIQTGPKHIAQRDPLRYGRSSAEDGKWMIPGP